MGRPEAEAEATIEAAGSPGDLLAIAALFREYAAAMIPHETRIEADLAALPGSYGRPGGSLLIAKVGGEPVGCVATRPIGPGTSELKRLYVAPRARGQGLGRRLIDRAIAEARAHGFHRMVLDTSPSMPEALHLYRSAGFREIPAYWDSPIVGVLFLGLTLGPERPGEI